MRIRQPLVDQTTEVKDNLFAFLRKRPEYDSGAVNEKRQDDINSGIMGLRSSFGNYDFFHGLGPKPFANVSPYFSTVSMPVKQGLFRMIKEGNNRVAF